MTATYPPTPELNHDAYMKERFGSELDDRMRTERDIVWALCHHLAARGFHLTSLYDGEEVIRVTDPKTAMEHVFNLDECILHFKFRGMVGERFQTMSVVLILGNGNDGLDIISDHSVPHPDPQGWNEAMAEFNTEQFRNGAQLDLISTLIGKVKLDDGESDQFYLLSRKDKEPLTPRQAKEWMLPRFYRDTHTPGGYFCHTVLAVQAEYSTTHVIATVQHRYDI